MLLSIPPVSRRTLWLAWLSRTPIAAISRRINGNFFSSTPAQSSLAFRMQRESIPWLESRNTFIYWSLCRSQFGIGSPFSYSRLIEYTCVLLWENRLLINLSVDKKLMGCMFAGKTFARGRRATGLSWTKKESAGHNSERIGLISNRYHKFEWLNLSIIF